MVIRNFVSLNQVLLHSFTPYLSLNILGFHVFEFPISGIMCMYFSANCVFHGMACPGDRSAS